MDDNASTDGDAAPLNRSKMVGCKGWQAHRILPCRGERKLVQTQLMLMPSHPNLVKTALKLLFASLTIICTFMSARPVVAQDEVLTTETSLVQLNVGVVDRQGQAVTTLSQNDFVVYEDNVRRPIVAFEPTQSPFSLVMLLDMSGSTVTFRQQIQQAALRFLDALGPDDRVAVIAFNGKGVHELIGFTSDRRKTAYAISLATGSGDTQLYDALKEALRKLAGEGKRRKAIVALTDGLDTEVRKNDRAILAKVSDAEVATVIKPETNSALTAVLSAADRQGVTIFPLALPSGDPKHLPLPDPLILAQYAAARTRMQMLADRTGGSIAEIRRLDQLAGVYVQVAASLRTLYSIAYQPPTVKDGKWRTIRVEVSRGDLTAKTKTGYYAK